MSLTDDQVNGMTLVITSGTGAPQARKVLGFTGSTDQVSVDAWITTPSSDSTYLLVATPDAGALTSAESEALSDIEAAVLAMKVKTDQLSFTVAGHVDANSEYLNGAEVAGDGSSGNPWTGNV